MNTLEKLDKDTIKSKDYGHLNLDERIELAAQKIANGELLSFRGASTETYLKVMNRAKQIELENNFPWCPCDECK